MRIHFRGLPSWRAVFLCLAIVNPAFAFDDEKPGAEKPAADKPGADKPAAEAKSRSKDKDDEYYELMKTFVDTFDQIERSYVKDVNRRQLLEAALKGMIKELDPYSSYIAPDEVARFNQEVEQEFGGIGIQVSIDPRNKRLTVMTPLPGTPAYRGGVRAGDVVMEIEGKSTEGFTIEDAVKVLKGKPGEDVTIGVLHAGGDKVETIKLTRELIHVSTVLGDRYKEDGKWNFVLDDKYKIGYLRLTHFSRRSAEEMQEAMEQLKELGLKGLVLDLRFNPGGLLTEATEIADMFVESGRIVSTKGRNTSEKVVEARAEGTFTGFPMVILVNHFSASASEIVSACLQDHKRAVVVGDRTWGKGSVQNVIELEGGSSALKLTTASYHRPSGKNIHRFPGAKDEDEWGVMPDKGFELKLDNEEMSKYLEYRRERDVLGKTDPPKLEFADKQLAKAVEYLTEQITGEKKPEEKKPEEKKPEEKKAATGALPKSNAARRAAA